MKATMDIKQIRRDVAKIRAMAGDPEAAHSAEDALWFRFIQHIADDAPIEFAEEAREVLKTVQIDFERWCA